MADVVADFDEIAHAIAVDSRPDAFTPAERFLLRQVPAHAASALDVGCGDGSFTRALAARGIATLGIDVSPGMIALARQRAGASPLLEYRLAMSRRMRRCRRRSTLWSRCPRRTMRRSIAWWSICVPLSRRAARCSFRT